MTFTWDGEEFAVPATRQLLLIAQLEDVLAPAGDGSALNALLKPEGPGLARLSMAYGAALRFAGAGVSNDVVYLRMQERFAAGEGAEAVAETQGAVLALLAVISPPVYRQFKDAGVAAGKPKDQAETAAAV